jgi:hypothetical protein
MSKKGKLILATAVFGAALFGASCGGGGGGGTASAPSSPSPTEEGKVLALLEVGSASAGTSKPVAICQLRSDNKALCGSDLNPSANIDLEYLYEFSDGNVVLKGPSPSNVIYFFNGSQVVRPDRYRELGATSDTPAPGGISIPSGATRYATPNFIIMLSGGNLVAVSRDGRVIKDSSVTSVNIPCETVTKGNIYKLNVDGTSSDVTATTPDEVLAQAGDKVLVKKSTQIRLTSSRCSITGSVLVATGSADDAKMVKVGDDFYIAVRDGTNLRYRKVSGSAVPVSVNITLASGANKHYYALDGRGRLYAITDTNTVSVYNIDGTLAGTATVTSVAGLLGLADRALAKDSTNVYEITSTGSAANKGTILYDVVNNCTNSTTIAIDGAGTNFIRCAHSSGLNSLTFDSGSGLYSQASHSVTTISEVKWATGKVLVKSGSVIKLCSTTTSSISCSDTDLPSLDPTSTDYLKFNGSEVFYFLSSGTLKVGDIFGPPSALSITVSSPSGGNASFNLNKFAFSFRPADVPSSCNTQIAYLSSRTASPKYYALPSGTCVTRILKVFP